MINLKSSKKKNKDKKNFLFSRVHMKNFESTFIGYTFKKVQSTQSLFYKHYRKIFFYFFPEKSYYIRAVHLKRYKYA